jgi:hypothetical protein
MNNNSEITRYIQENHGLTLSAEKMANRTELEKFEQSSTPSIDHIQTMKKRCTEAVCAALDNYHHPEMSTSEILTIVRNVIANRIEFPEWVEVVGV